MQSRNPSIQIRAIPTMARSQHPLISPRSKSQSLHTDQGNSDVVRGESNADQAVVKSQSLHTDQGNSDCLTGMHRSVVSMVVSQSLHTDQGNSDCRLPRVLILRGFRAAFVLPPNLGLPIRRLSSIPRPPCLAQPLLSTRLAALRVTCRPEVVFALACGSRHWTYGAARLARRGQVLEALEQAGDDLDRGDRQDRELGRLVDDETGERLAVDAQPLEGPHRLIDHREDLAGLSLGGAARRRGRA